MTIVFVAEAAETHKTDPVALALLPVVLILGPYVLYRFHIKPYFYRLRHPWKTPLETQRIEIAQEFQRGLYTFGIDRVAMRMPAGGLKQIAHQHGYRLFDLDRAVSMKSEVRIAECGCNGIVSAAPSSPGS